MDPKTREQAGEEGFAVFNRYPHLCVEVPDGGLTITCKTTDGKRVTFSFCPYKDGGVPECVDILYHDSGVKTTNGDKEVPIQEVVGFTPGGTQTHLRFADKCSLVTIPLNKPEKTPEEIKAEWDSIGERLGDTIGPKILEKKE